MRPNRGCTKHEIAPIAAHLRYCHSRLDRSAAVYIAAAYVTIYLDDAPENVEIDMLNRAS